MLTVLHRSALALVLCAQPLLAADDHDDHSDHLSETGDLRLIHAWTNATDDAETLVFVEIENTGSDTAVLTGGEAEIADTVELVAFQMQGGTGVLVPLPDLPIAPGSDMVLGPDGVALRLTGLSAALETDDSFGMEVHFGDTHAEVTVQVEPANARQHRHAGHSH